MASAEITSYIWTQKDLPELFFTMVCVYVLCAFLPVNICNLTYKMQSTCYVHFMSYDDQRNVDLIFLHMIPIWCKNAAYLKVVNL